MVVMSPHLEFKDVSVAYGSKKALDRVSLSVPQNTILGIVGPILLLIWGWMS